jgi:hypothetical protein
MNEPTSLPVINESRAWVDRLNDLVTTTELLLSSADVHEDVQHAVQLQDLDLAVERAAWLFEALRAQLAEDLVHGFHFSPAMVPSELMRRPLSDEPPARAPVRRPGPLNWLAAEIEAWPLQLQRWHDVLPARDVRFACVLALRLCSCASDIEGCLERLAEAVRSGVAAQYAASEADHRDHDRRTRSGTRRGDR